MRDQDPDDVEVSAQCSAVEHRLIAVRLGEIDPAREQELDNLAAAVLTRPEAASQ
jgi:hypothetical protein